MGIIINESGAVAAAKIVSSSDPIFETAALEAVKLWRFAPAKKNGQPVAMSYTVPVIFQLN